MSLTMEYQNFQKLSDLIPSECDWFPEEARITEILTSNTERQQKDFYRSNELDYNKTPLSHRVFMCNDVSNSGFVPYNVTSISEPILQPDFLWPFSNESNSRCSNTNSEQFWLLSENYGDYTYDNQSMVVEQDDQHQHPKSSNEPINVISEVSAFKQPSALSDVSYETVCSNTPPSTSNTIDIQLSHEPIRDSLLPSSVQDKKKRKPKQKMADKLKVAIEKKHEKYVVKEPCSCKRKCQEKISHDRRTEINKKFWELDFIAQKLYIRAQSTIASPRTVNQSTGPTRLAINYVLKDENGQNWQVCQYFFLSTLGFKPNNNTIVRNALEREFPVGDGRGKHSNRKKFDESIIVDHIMGFHPNSSHYRREHAPFRLYLPSDVTISRMHKMFVENKPTQLVSYDYYRKVVDKLNISFTKLGHEKCEQCEVFLQHKHAVGVDSSSCDMCIQHSRHQQFYTQARIQYDADKRKADDPKHVVVSADQEKVIMVPRLEQFKEVIFTKRVCVFNETFAPIGKHSIFPPFAALWHEGIAGRKKEELISAYHSFLLFHRDAATVTIWTDNCTAQNKNWALYSFLVYIINSKEIAAESITMKYLEKGHTFMSADSFHHQVELAMKNYERGSVCDFDDFVHCVQSANGQRVVAKQLQFSDFADWPDWSSIAKLNHAQPRPYVAEFSQLKFVRGKTTMFYANNFDDQLTELDFIMTKHQGLSRPAPRSANCGISQAIKNGIVSKIAPLMPENRRNFWTSIPTNT